MTEYDLIRAISSLDLVKKVQEAQSKGWTPIGGVAVVQVETSSKGTRIEFYQAIGR